MFDLTNKIAVITGSASGIGRAIAIVFAKQGAIVHLLDMNEEGLTNTAALLNIIWQMLPASPGSNLCLKRSPRLISWSIVRAFPILVKLKTPQKKISTASTPLT